jgi:hypothetical protein
MTDLEIQVQIDLFIEHKLEQGNGMEFIHQKLTDLVDISIEDHQEIQARKTKG